MQRRLQPLARSYLALIAEAITIRPSAALHEQLNRLFDLTLVRITLFDHRNGNAVRTENDLGPLRVGEPRQRLIYLLDQRLQVKLVTIEGFDATGRDAFPKS